MKITLKTSSPKVKGEGPNALTFLIDSGAEPCLIKEKAVLATTYIDKGRILYLSGITEKIVPTLGKIKATIMGRVTDMHIIPDTFPIEEDGIVGCNFLSEHKAKINWDENCLEVGDMKRPFHQNLNEYTLPPRARQLLKIKLKPTTLKEGLIEKIKIHDDVFIGNAMVTNENNHATIYAINTSEKELQIRLPEIELHEIDEIKECDTKVRKRIANRRKRRYNKCLKTGVLTITENTRFERILKLVKIDHLLPEEVEEIKFLLENSLDRYHLPDEPLPATNILEHNIITTDEIPVYQKQYRLPPVLKQEITKETEKLLKHNIIEPSFSPYSTPLWVVPKRSGETGEKKYRMVLDFRALNKKTVPDRYPLASILDILDQLGGAKFFSVFDLSSSFHQIKMSEKDKHKTAFTTPNGLYNFLRMPFGLRNAAATFQRLIDIVLRGLNEKECFAYIDDVVIHAKTLSEHRRKYLTLIERLREANLQLEPTKCEFLRREVCYLGHKLSQNGVSPDPRKLSAVSNFPRPKTPLNVKQFLGLTSYYRRFINDFSKYAKPLNKLTETGVPFIWTSEQEEAFQALKLKLCEEPCLIYPNFDEPFILTTDASNIGLGGILSQGEIYKDKPVAYVSRFLADRETRYSAYEKEMLAIVYCVEHFRNYLYGRKFTILTDHQPLSWLKTKEPSNRYIKWLIKLEQYDFDVVYKPGKNNLNADALSRNPVDDNNVTSTSQGINESKILTLTQMPNRPKRNIKMTEAGQQYREMIDKKQDKLNKKKNTPKITVSSTANGKIDNTIQSERREITKHNMPSTSKLNESIFNPNLVQGPKNKHVQKRQYNLRNKREKILSDKFTSTTEEDTDIEMSSQRRNKSFKRQKFLSRKDTSGNSSDNETDTEIRQNKYKGQKYLSHNKKERTHANDTSTYDSEEEFNDTSDSLSSLESGSDIEDKTNKNKQKQRKNNKNDNYSFEEDINDTTDKELQEVLRESEDESEESVNESKEKENDNPNSSIEIKDLLKRYENTRNIYETSDQLYMRRDNILFATNTLGGAIDNAAQTFGQRKEIGHFGVMELGTASAVRINSRYHMAICVSDTKAECDRVKNKNILSQALHDLSQIIHEKNIESFSMSRIDDFNEIKWEEIFEIIYDIFGKTNIKITICNNTVTTPANADRYNLIKEFHCSAIGGHKGMTKCYNYLRQFYYWENMKLDIENFINQCLQCKLKKVVRRKHKPEMILTDTAGQAFERLAIDIVGPLPLTEDNNKFILTMQCMLTKYCLAAPLSNISASAVADAFVNNYICIYGPCKIILSDQGSNFLSKVFREVAKRFKIKCYTTSAYHAKTNGSLERSHIVLIDFLSTISEEDYEWDKWLNLAMYSYNISKNSSTGFCPFTLVFGKIPIPISSFTLSNQSKLTTYNDYLKRLIIRLHKTKEEARKNLIEAKIRSKKYYDKQTNLPRVAPGTYVFLKKGLKKGKLGDRYEGPCKITEVLDNNRIKIKIKNKEKIVNIERIAPSKFK